MAKATVKKVTPVKPGNELKGTYNADASSPATKKAVKKATPAPKAKEVAPSNPNRLGKSQMKILEALSTKDAAKGLTRGDISLKTGLTSGWCGLLGHLSPEKTEPQSLAGRGFLTLEADEARGHIHKITDAGKEALAAAKQAAKDAA